MVAPATGDGVRHTSTVLIFDVFFVVNVSVMFALPTVVLAVAGVICPFFPPLLPIRALHSALRTGFSL